MSRSASQSSLAARVDALAIDVDEIIAPRVAELLTLRAELEAVRELMQAQREEVHLLVDECRSEVGALREAVEKAQFRLLLPTDRQEASR